MAQRRNSSAVGNTNSAEMRPGTRLHIAGRDAYTARPKSLKGLANRAENRRGQRYRRTKGDEEASESPRFTRGEARSVTWVAHQPLLPYLTSKTRERFWSYVKVGRPDECWEWQGAGKPRGYGNFRLKSYTNATASRVAYAIANGEEPGQLLVLHSCDNPPCCNPAHLWLGTDLDNSNDKIAKGRFRSGSQKGAENGNATLDEAKVIDIWRRIQEGQSNVRIAEAFNVTHSLISRIRHQLSWREVTEKLGAPKPVFKRKTTPTLQEGE